MNRDEIKEFLPHREPMLLVDEITVLEDGTACGKYRVRGDEFFLQGHFPGTPVVPGVILCEMAAQSASAPFSELVRGKIPLFTGIDKVKFRAPARPGDEITFMCGLSRSKHPFYFCSAKGYIGGALCMSGEFSFALTEPEKGA